jgi:hypothetical protein
MIKRKNTNGSRLLILAAIGLTFVAWSSKSMAFDKEAFCRFDMKMNQERAEWGAKLRAEMLTKCRGQVLQKCGQPWVSLVNKQYEKDVAELIELFDRKDYSPATRIRSQASLIHMKIAALDALEKGLSPSSIAVDLYRDCLRVK